MSWDNVKGVSAAQVWTDNPDMTQAYLFANGNHQVKLTAAVSFTLTDATQPGPTQDEVKAALSLIDFDTGAGISRLKTGDKGQYAYVYLPNLPTAIKRIEAIETSDAGSYQYEFDYYVSSDSTINASYGSEKVALFLSYTNTSGSKVEYNTASRSKSQSFVAITVYQPKKYGMSNSNMSPIVFQTIEDNATFEELVFNGVVNHLYSPNAMTYGLKIDDGYFRITNYKTVDTPVSPTAFLQHRIDDLGDKFNYYYVVAHGFLPQENKLNSGIVKYTSKIDFVTMYDYFLIEFGVNVTGCPGQIMFIRFNCGIMYNDYNGDGPIANSGGQAKLTIYDQFGNTANIEIDNSGDGYLKLTSVV